MENKDKIDISELKDKVKMTDVLNYYGIKIISNKILCPFHYDKNPSMQVSNNFYYCYGCGCYGDIISFVMSKEKKSFIEAINFINDVISKGVITENTPEIPLNEQNRGKIQNIEQIQQYIQSCTKNAKMTDYFYSRGFNDETIKRYCLGYDIEKHCIIIPYNKIFSYYQSRSIMYKSFYKPPKQMAGEEPLFNQALLSTDKIVFVVESPICAISIGQCGYNAIALCGTANAKKLLRFLNTNVFTGTLVLCLDNDNAGIKATQNLINGYPANNILGLNKLNIKFLVFNVAGFCKDPNELLLKNKKILLENLKEAEENAKQI